MMKIGRDPKGKACLLTFHFHERTVSFRVGRQKTNCCDQLLDTWLAFNLKVYIFLHSTHDIHYLI